MTDMLASTEFLISKIALHFSKTKCTFLLFFIFFFTLDEEIYIKTRKDAFFIHILFPHKK